MSKAKGLFLENGVGTDFTSPRNDSSNQRVRTNIVEVRVKLFKKITNPSKIFGGRFKELKGISKIAGKSKRSGSNRKIVSNTKRKVITKTSLVNGKS